MLPINEIGRVLNFEGVFAYQAQSFIMTIGKFQKYQFLATLSIKIAVAGRFSIICPILLQALLLVKQNISWIISMSAFVLEITAVSFQTAVREIIQTTVRPCSASVKTFQRKYFLHLL